MQIRLNKYLSESGVCSRREADEHILAGKIKINGEIAKLGDKVDPEKDKVYFDGKLVKQENDLVYYAVYKPAGIISTSSDELNRANVVSLVPKEPRVYPIGRLDKDSEGLMILTNDGNLTLELSHPSKKHEKEYIVRTIRSRTFNLKDLSDIKSRFGRGLRIDDQLMKAWVVSARSIPNSKLIVLNMVLHTGYNRQIRKMCDRIGLEVIKLKRIRIEKLKLDNLNHKAGEWKKISPKDIL